MKHIAGILALFAAAGLTAATVHVDNVKGDDANDGSAERPVASIERGLALLKRSDRLEVAPNGGKPYRRPYPGAVGRSLDIRLGGTAEQPMVIDGNGAVISGLSAVPADRWKEAGNGVYELPFWPMSNMYKHYAKQDYWLPESRIFFVDGKAAANCLTRAEMEKTPGGFWWSRRQRKLFFRPPEGKTIAELTVELPANAGFYVLADHVRVENFTVSCLGMTVSTRQATRAECITATVWRSTTAGRAFRATAPASCCTRIASRCGARVREAATCTGPIRAMRAASL